MVSSEASAGTLFAPAARRSPAEIAGQVEALGGVGGLAPVLDAVPHLVFLLNAERQILLANRAARTLAAALARPAIVGMRLGELLGCRNEGAAPAGCGTGAGCRTCGAVQATLAAIAGREATLECRIASEGGEAFDLRVQATPFRVGAHDHVLVVLDDIADEKRRAVLERVFFHDVLNTASGVCGIANLIAADPTALPEFKDDLVASSDMLVDEIRSQRLLLAAETRELQAHPEAVAVRRLLEDVRALYRHHPAAPGRHVDVDAAPDLTLSTDATILRRVLGNLVKNALEASPPGARVGLAAKAEGDRVVFTCRNTGVIPPEVARQLFVRSFTTKGAGRGIGTYSIKLFSEQYLDGAVTFTSTPEVGTCFTVALPKTLGPRRAVRAN